jgi:lathosterol oxidase
MLISTIIERWGWPALLGGSFVYSLILYGIGSGLSYHWHFGRKRRRLMPDYVPNRRENRWAILLSVLSIAGNCLLLLPVLLAIGDGHSRLYESVGEHGWAWAALSVAGAIAFVESAIYWIHRGLHTPLLFRWLHCHHHRFRMPTPFISFAFHPLDNFAQSAPYHLYIFLVPMPEAAYLALLGLAAVWTLLIHDRVVWVSPKLVNNTGCHTAHHWYCRYNYGNYFTFWDRLCATYFNPTGLPAKFFAAKHGALRPSTAAAPVPHAPAVLPLTD